MESASPVKSEVIVMVVCVGPMERRVIIPPPVTIYIACVVIGNIDDFNFPWLHDDDLFFLTNNQVIKGIQIALIK